MALIDEPKSSDDYFVDEKVLNLPSTSLTTLDPAKIIEFLEELDENEMYVEADGTYNNQ